jgi:hypothetical protein
VSSADGLTNGDIDALIERVARADRLHEHHPELSRDGVTLHDVELRKDGSLTAAEATLLEDDIAGSLPAGLSLSYDAEADGDGIVFRGATSLLGASLPISARALAAGGAIIVVPDGLPVGRLTVFDHPRVRVDRLSADPADGGLRVRIEVSFVG